MAGAEVDSSQVTVGAGDSGDSAWQISTDYKVQLLFFSSRSCYTWEMVDLLSTKALRSVPLNPQSPQRVT